MAHPAQGWLAVAFVRRPHGIHGEITAEVHSDFPERLTAGITVGIGAVEPERFCTVRRVRTHKGLWLLLLEGIEDRQAAESLREQWLFLPAQERSELPPTYYYEHEIAGLVCLDTSGTRLGQALGFAEYGGGHLLRVAVAGQEVLVPFCSPIVVRVDLPGGAVILDPPAGLFDGDAL
ncbi:MAG: 16S rRNA processing protein RimM [Thermoanaerobaculaceae bacterium]|jgi:16S rRNA processing protein RimM|nr:16S rRNA processing protein RimM [Thermoanaerobaculaceae bacterium]